MFRWVIPHFERGGSRPQPASKTFIIYPRRILPSGGACSAAGWEENPGELQRIAQNFKAEGRLCEFDVYADLGGPNAYRLTCYDPGRDNWANRVYKALLEAGFTTNQIRLHRNFSRAGNGNDDDFQAVSAQERGWA